MTGRLITAVIVLAVLVSCYLGHQRQAAQIQLLTTQLSNAQADADAARQQLAAANTAATADQAALQADCSARLAAATTAQQLTRSLAHVPLVARPAPALAASGLSGGTADPALAVQPRDRGAVRGAVPTPFDTAGPQGQPSAVPGAVDDQVAGLAVPGGLEAPDAAAADGPGGPELAVAAVGLWNAALLAGGPQPDGWPAAPACGADAAPGQPGAVDAEACAQSAGLTLAHAWANHIANAASCATDRARLVALQQAVHARWPIAAGDTP